MAEPEMTGRLVDGGPPVRIRVSGDRIAAIEPLGRPACNDDDWLVPAFFDLQTNGRWGVSFSDTSLTVEQVAEIVLAHASLGTARLCPTLISAPRAATLHGVRTIAEACRRYPEVAAMVLGIHLEGPYLSGLDGYRGAHAAEVLRDPDWDEFRAFQEAAGGLITLMSLAPERPGSIPFVRRAVAEGVQIALGHTAADGPTLRAAAAAGARLSTHLGNGIVAQLPRHPNPIWDQAACDDLSASFIADGPHLGPETLRVLARAKGPERVILVSDFSPLAGLPPGRYGTWEIGADRRINVAGTPYLAGANEPLAVGLGHLIDATGWAPPTAIGTVTSNPARLLDRLPPRLAVGEPASLVRLTLATGPDGTTHVRVRETWIDGRRFAPVD